MRDGSGKHVRDRLDSPVRMPRKSRQIVFRNIVAKIVQQEERVELFCISETECAAEVHAGTLESRFRFDNPFNRSNRHIELQRKISILFHVEGSDGLASSALPVHPVKTSVIRGSGFSSHQLLAGTKVCPLNSPGETRST